jgi:hypothetical protein
VARWRQAETSRPAVREHIIHITGSAMEIHRLKLGIVPTSAAFPYWIKHQDTWTAWYWRLRTKDCTTKNLTGL